MWTTYNLKFIKLQTENAPGMFLKKRRQNRIDDERERYK